MKKLIIVLTAIVMLALLASCGDGGDETQGTAAPATEPVGTESETDSETVDPNKYNVEEIKDESGKKVGSRGYTTDGVLRYEEEYDVAGRTVHRVDYNDAGNVAVVSDFTFLSGKEPDHYTIEDYEYELGKLSRRTVTKYNKMMLPDSIYVYDADDGLVEAYLYEYSSSGRVLKLSNVDSKNVLRLITEYEYNDDGLLVRETYKKGSGTVSSYTTYDYNENGRVLRESSYSPDGEMYGYLEYVYDESGNFVEQVEYVKDEDGNFVPF